jgi:folate-binding protein YgfZ
VHLAGREVLAVTGPQRQKFLHGLLSQDLASLSSGQGRPAALMDARGHLLALMRVLVAPDAILLETTPGRREVVERTLTHYRVGAPVRFASPPVQVLALLGPATRDALARAGAAVPDLAAEAHVVATLGGHEVRVARAGDVPAGGHVVHVPADHVEAIEALLRGAGAVAVEAGDLDALRIEEGRPWYGPDVSEENLLHETGLVAVYHSPSKGCYVGQEVIARLEARGGNVNKALRGLRLDAPVAPGAPVLRDGQDAGRVTTSATSPRLGPIALAYVHRGSFEDGTAVTVDGVPGTVRQLPLVP